MYYYSAPSTFWQNISSYVPRSTTADISSCLSLCVDVLQRFQLEEHLIIHRHKHEMTLKFPSIKTDTAFTGEPALSETENTTLLYHKHSYRTLD